MVGASSGGIEALVTIASHLPRDFPAPICVVVHTAPDAPGVLDRIVSRAGGPQALSAQTGMRLQPGFIYVAPPDHHLIVEPGVLRLSKGPRENRSRPAVDPLFRSAAQVYGPGTIGIVLTGNLDDGTAGLHTVKQMGGVAIVQDPADAMYPSMPRSALRHVAVDYSVPLAEIPELLLRIVHEPAEAAARAVPADVEVEVKIANEEDPEEAGLRRISEPSPFACPECHGVLRRLKADKPERYRCHTGHAYSPESLLAAVSEAMDTSLWNAIRALTEGAMLLEQFAAHAGAAGETAARLRLEEGAGQARRQTDVLRELAMARQAVTSS